MAFEPILLVNCIVQLASALAALLVARGLGKGKSCALQKPFYLMSLALGIMSMLNLLWFSGVLSISILDNLLIGPFFHLIMLAVWFYVGLMMSGHDHFYYLIPLFIMSINVLLLLSNLALVTDIIVGLVLVGIFFYVGFVDHHLLKKLSYIGMVYGASISAVSVVRYLFGIGYLTSYWFIPDAVLLYLLFRLRKSGYLCASNHADVPHHIPVVVEVFKFGFFVIALSFFMMLGTLGMHELGHSLAAGFLGCEHSTSFGISFAITHVSCSSDAGATAITLGGFVLTLLVSLMMFFIGNDFTRKMSYMLIAFSLLTAMDDFSVLGLPYSLMVIAVFIAALLAGYGLILIVKDYEAEYERYESKVCSPLGCGRQMYLNQDMR
ncbi:hypothetical protein KY363_03480 [Candidatus Woesearchaeota archaeon]|nr:hypothetical protein [Candidatus Woesearchaeota archaeon]